MKIRLAAGALAIVISAAIMPASAVADSSLDKVTKALSGYHFAGSAESLEKLAGSREELVTSLLSLRTNDSIPFVAIRAERLLLGYADDPRVGAALGDDLNSTERKGLARTVVLHLDSAPASARQALGRQAIERAARDAEFRPYARALQSSTDPELRELSRSIK